MANARPRNARLETAGTDEHADYDYVHEIKPVEVEVVNFPETQQSVTQSHFTPGSLLITAGQFLTVGANPYRRRLVMYTDSGNTQPVWVGKDNNAFSGAAPYPNAIALAPNSGLVEFQHTAQLTVFCSAAATVYFWEERNTVK